MLIGLCGLIGSGKGTVADILVEKHNFQKISFADKLKDGVASVFDWPRDLLEGNTAEGRNWREQPDTFWTGELKQEITPRYVLQVFGTECMRHGFFDGIWVSLVKQKIIDNPTQHWVIPDVRFPNEVKMIKTLKGQMMLVKRGQDPQWFTDYKDKNIEPNDTHASEWAWANTTFDRTIVNNATLKDLHQQVEISMKLTLMPAMLF